MEAQLTNVFVHSHRWERREAGGGVTRPQPGTKGGVGDTPPTLPQSRRRPPSRQPKTTPRKPHRWRRRRRRPRARRQSLARRKTRRQRSEAPPCRCGGGGGLRYGWKRQRAKAAAEALHSACALFTGGACYSGCLPSGPVCFHVI